MRGASGAGALALLLACAACDAAPIADEPGYQFNLEDADAATVAKALADIEKKPLTIGKAAEARARCTRITIRFLQPAKRARIEQSVTSSMAQAGLALATSGESLVLELLPGVSPDCAAALPAQPPAAPSASAPR